MPYPRALTPDQQEKAWELWLRRFPQTAIARQMGVNRNTVGRTIKRIQRELTNERQAELEQVRTLALAEYDVIKREAWQSRQKCAPSSTASVGYLSTIIEARKQQDRLLGLEEVTVTHRGLVLARLETVLGEGVPILLPGEAP